MEQADTATEVIATAVACSDFSLTAPHGINAHSYRRHCSVDGLILPCRMQQVSLSFHFAVEQRARSFLRTFFGFNGTAGVWRRRCEATLLLT